MPDAKRVGGEDAIGEAGVGDLLRLAIHAGGGLVRHGRGADTGETGCRWARELAARQDATGIRLPIPGRTVEIVTDRGASDRILAHKPDANDYGTGAMKRDGMSFLAPHALTIADGERWQELRSFNEKVLAAGDTHPNADVFLDVVRTEFSGPVRDIAGIRAAMAAVMTRIVLGDGDDDAQMAHDVTALFNAVQSPVRRRLLGWRYAGQRRRFRAALERRLNAVTGTEPTLLARASTAGSNLDRSVLLDQLPHWMFTFTGSGTDLLTRTLALVTARPAVRERVSDEVAGAEGARNVNGMEQLAFLNACVLETGRLFPPVTRTFHTAPGGRQLIHVLPLLQRDDALGPDVHSFRPGRWLSAGRDAAANASNLFLRGPRSCPGAELITFVCVAAIARQVADFGVVAQSERLGRDPLPFTFPNREARFTTSAIRNSLVEARP